MLHARFRGAGRVIGAVAEVPGAADLLTEALGVWDQRFFDAEAGMFVDSWNRGFTQLSDYRGVNANMHAVEALLAAADVIGDHALRSVLSGRSPGSAGVREAAFVAHS